MSIKKDIMNDFDFENVAMVMKFVGWKYNDNKKSPTIQELKDVAGILIDDILKDNTIVSVGTGGFKTYWNYLDDDDRTIRALKLDFILESAHALE